jgi:hypothetical protein
MVIKIEKLPDYDRMPEAWKADAEAYLLNQTFNSLKDVLGERDGKYPLSNFRFAEMRINPYDLSDLPAVITEVDILASWSEGGRSYMDARALKARYIPDKPITYKEAGVNLEKLSELEERFRKELIKEL